MICVFLAIATLALYWQGREFDFTHFDDNLYVTDNTYVNSGLTWSGILWAFTRVHANNWHPVTWISHMIDCQIADVDPAWHHLVNVALHAANAVLLFLLLSKMTGARWRSAFVAALFAVHPLHVESVVWVSERKDVLSTLFWFLTTLAYVRYVQSPKARQYALVVVLFVLGLLSKPMLVTLPLTLLLLDWWPLGRCAKSFERVGTGFGDEGIENCTVTDQSSAAKNVVKLPALRHMLANLPDKLPLLVLAAASAVTTFVVQRITGAVESLNAYPIGERVANAVVAYVAYIKMMFLPTKLACLYPHPKDTLPPWQVAGSAVLLVLLSWLFVRIARWRPYWLVGWLWYLITLIPVIGLVQVGKQALADRYTYVPLIGLFVIISWGIPDLVGVWLGKVDASSKVSAIIAASLGTCALISLLPITYRQIGCWRDDITLWNRAIAVTRNNAVAHYNLGTTLAALGDMDGAQRHFSEAVRADPQKYDAHNNLGGILLYKGQIDKAIAHFRMAVKLKPDYPDAQCNLGLALLQRGDYRRAIVHFNECLKHRPNDTEALNGLQEAQELIDNSNRVDSKKTD